MHMLIYALVEANDSSEAVSVASSNVFDHLVGAVPNSRSVEFDYYTTFADYEDSSVSGEGRYGPKPEAALVTSYDGSGMLWRGWNFTRSEKHKYLDEIREELDNWSNDEIMAGWNSDADIRYYEFLNVGERAGPTVHLYDDTGYTFGITGRHAIESILGEHVGDVSIEPYETLDFDEENHVESQIDRFHGRLQEAVHENDGVTTEPDLWIVPADVHF